MDANSNQRKRGGGRQAKNVNDNSMSPTQTTEDNEVMEVSAVAISPTLEETTANTPAAECRRSSRKKIIKFDVRDLLNKNRKTHKIQIEARIDSNAPTTSKASNACGAESVNSKIASTVREDMLSKQKTFLEKSAIFRRYSISQDHKPPPLPMPPLLGKANDNKDSCLSSTASNRRLSRTQEFFSNVMIKPKQTTSLIVAQIESNTPSSTSGTAKRKSLNKSAELVSKTKFCYETEASPVVQQKKRGRPAKLKSQTTVESNALMTEQQGGRIKISPEKAKNWKEYKACLAQQSTTNQAKTENKEKLNVLKSEQEDKSKQEYLTSTTINLEETSQSDVSKSEDDFSGFHTSKDDISCDSPVLANKSLDKDSNMNESLNKVKEVRENANKEIGIAGKKNLKTKIQMELNENDTTSEANLLKIQEILDKNSHTKVSETKQIETNPAKETKQVAPKETETPSCAKKDENQIETKSNEELAKCSLNKKSEEIQITFDYYKTEKPFKRVTRNSPELLEKKEVEVQKDSDLTSRSELKIENENFIKKPYIAPTDSTKEVAINEIGSNIEEKNPETKDDKNNETLLIKDSKEMNVTDKANLKQPISNKRRLLRIGDTNVTPTPSKELQDQQNEMTQEILLQKRGQNEISKQETETQTKTQSLESEPDSRRELKTPEILSKAAQQFVEECTPQTKLTATDILLLTSQMPLSQPSTPSESSTKSFSRTSSSSESENNSERSSYSSEPSSASSSTSTSSRSYKSGDKLRVSIKRITLPKSPSTSSQTSTSEELNSTHTPITLKKKPPMAKRSKRLQKKIVEMQENNDNENIDESFQKIVSDEKDVLSVEDVTVSMVEDKDIICENSKSCIKEDELVEVSSETIRKSLENTEAKQACENLDVKGNESLSSSKTKNVSTVKRKSLRSRKDYSSDDKDEKNEPDEKCTQSQITEKPLKEIIVKELLVEEEPNRNVLENLPEKHIEIQEVVFSDNSVQSEDNKQKRKTRNTPTRKQQPQRRLKHQLSLEVEQAAKKEDIAEVSLNSEDTTTQEVKSADKSAEELNLEINQQALVKFKNTTIIEKTTCEAFESKTVEVDSTATSTRSKSNREEATNEGEEFNSCKQKVDLQDDSTPIIPKVGTLDNLIDITEAAKEELTTIKSKTNKEVVTKVQEEHFVNEPTQISPKELEKVKTLESAIKYNSEKTNNEIYTDLQENVEKVTPTRSNINKDKTSIKENLSLDINLFDDSQNTSLEDKKKFAISDICEITIEKSKSSTDTDKETSSVDKADNSEQASKATMTEVLNISTIRGGTKQINIEDDKSPESVKTANYVKTETISSTGEFTPIVSTNINPNKHAEFIGSSRETLKSLPEISAQSVTTCAKIVIDQVTEISLSNPSPTIETNVHAESSNSSQETQESSHSTTSCSKHELKDRTSSAKRMSLRKQNKEQDSTEAVRELETTEAANLRQQQGKLQTNTSLEEIPKVNKRRGRKSRFKNLYGPDGESETDSSNGNNTPVAEITQQKIKGETFVASEHKEHIKIVENIVIPQETPQEVVEKLDEIEENPNNILSSHIQNVSIETNTLLDILRTVQSNTEAALKVGKPALNTNETDQENAGETSTVQPNLENIFKTEKSPTNNNEMENDNVNMKTTFENLRLAPANTEANLKDDQTQTNHKDQAVLIAAVSGTNINELENENAAECTTVIDIQKCSEKSQDKEELQTKHISETKPNFSTRTDRESPLTLKRMPLSPARSDSNSPLTLKKVTQSPTRSDSSSPLTLKKVTRRYERRSRRGEDSSHKTLEETFAEIAEQSSKAVLAAKEFDTSELQTTDEKLPLVVNDNISISPTNVEKVQNVESFTEIEKSSTDFVMTATNVVEVEILEKNLENISQLIDEVEKTEIVKPIANENIVGIQENTKVTTARRGRKPKNRALESQPISVAKEEFETQNSTAILKDVGEEKLLETIQLQAATKEIPLKNSSPLEGLIQKTDTKLEIKTCKTKKAKETSNLDITQTGTSVLEEQTPKENVEISQTTAEPFLKTLDESNDGKPSKKSIKKSDLSKALEEHEMKDITTLEAVIKNDKEDEVRTPKQSVKKRDTSQTKNETKSMGKKSSKKTKNEEDNATFTKSASITTTPPPSKRGRKPKSQQEISQTTASSKKKNRKESSIDQIEEELNEEKRSTLETDSDSLNTSLDRSMDDKLAKKKRQKKLKEAFEAALTDNLEKNKEALYTEITSCSRDFGLTRLNKSLSPPRRPSDSIGELNESLKITCVTPVEAEEDPDPLKDIEKFIADGVNLLKKDYKLDEDSVDDVIAPTQTPSKNTVEILEQKCTAEDNEIFHTFETPADTPINTPSVTPPPKSPSSIESSTPDEISGVRRSHRIKLITKTPKALVGRGLVRDKERFSIKDDVETKSHYTLDDHLTDLAEVEAKNAKFLKEMEERLSNFQVIKENEYLCERVISREARKMICDCFLTHEEEERGELGCGEDCLNRLLMIECGPECNVKERCTNKRFQKLLCSPCRVFRTEKKGFGIMADIEILPGEFIMEYVGEVIDTEEFEKRRIIYSQDKNRHYYFMALRSDAIIDATIKGNISRFINHSCDPNAETQKWTVNGELRIGFFSRKSIMPGEEITFNYQYQRYGREAQRCYCESANCRGWIGQEPTSDEGEQIDDDDDETEDDDEEEADTSNLLVHDDDEDSDASVADPEEVQKQLEMAAAQAEVELAPLQLMEEKLEHEQTLPEEGKSAQDTTKPESEEDSKSKFKKLLSKMAEKVAAKQKQTKREQKQRRKKKSKESSSDLSNKLKYLEDPDIEDEVEFLKECGLKNQSDTLRLSRLMVRAKLVQTRLNLLEILRLGDLPCRRLFLDYHGLRLLHGWMSEDAGNMQIRLSLLQTLETLPIANKTVLTDSKVMQVVRNWCGNNAVSLSPNEDSSSSNSNSQDMPAPNSTNFEDGSEMAELQKLALKLITNWEGLPEIFRIPKKERIEQMKEHEREADRQYAANAETQENNIATDRYRRDRFGRGFNTSNTIPNSSNRFIKPNNGNPHRVTNTTPESNKNLSKAQRREMFAAKVARDEAEKRLAEERREFETKCRFFGLDPKKTRTQDIPFCVNPATGQWFSIERKPITTPPSYAHVQVPVKPKSTDPNDYQLPAVCTSLPPQWKYVITPQGKIYYYHIKYRVPQWEPPSPAQLQQCDIEAREDDSESELTTTAGEDSSDDDDDVLIGMDAAQLKAYIDRKVEMRIQRRYQRLVDERSISPRREEDRIYNQIEVRKYKENKEKIRKRKEEIRRKRAEALRQTSLNMCTLGSITDIQSNTNVNKLQSENEVELGTLPIQDYLLSSDEEVDIKAEVNSPLIDKIVEGDKIVDELDALTTKRQLKRPLPPHRDLNEPSTSSAAASTSAPNPITARQEYKKRKLEKKEKRKPKEQDAKYRKNKEKFRCEIAGIIVHHLKPYRKETCAVGRIQSNDDFNHLARKLTHFVMIKELKYCESVGQTLVVTESVKSKSREFIKKYMAKYGDVYIKPSNDPDFKDIPFTL